MYVGRHEKRFNKLSVILVNAAVVGLAPGKVESTLVKENWLWQRAVF
jgi:hypothetical protein